MKLYIPWGPDNLPIIAGWCQTREQAQQEIDRFPNRFKQQGYYAGVGYRLALQDITAHCRIEEVEADREDIIEILLEHLAEYENSIMADLETGSHHSNNRAAEEFAKRYTFLGKWGQRMAELRNAIEELED